MDFTFVPSQLNTLLLLSGQDDRKQSPMVLINHLIAVRVASVD
jgi:hypothetical protein